MIFVKHTPALFMNIINFLPSQLTPLCRYDKVTPMKKMLDLGYLVSDDDNSSSDEVWDLDS